MLPGWVGIEDDISNARVNFELVTSSLTPMTSNEQGFRSKRTRQLIPCCMWASALFKLTGPARTAFCTATTPLNPHPIKRELCYVGSWVGIII